MPDTYVACAMSALSPEEYETFRHTVLVVCDALREVGRIPYSEPFEQADFGEPVNARTKNLAVLDTCKAFVLLYTSKEATSSLIELGYALKRGIPITVFAREGIKLPFYLQGTESTSFKVRIVQFGKDEELPGLAKNALS